MKFKLFISISLLFLNSALFTEVPLYVISSHQDIENAFPKSPSQMLSFKENTLELSQIELTTIRDSITTNTPINEVTTSLDKLLNYLKTRRSICEALTLVTPNNDLRNEALITEVAIKNYYASIFSGESEIYQYLKVNAFQLEGSKKEFIKEILDKFECNGQSLSSSDRLKVQRLNNDIIILEQLFAKNIQEDESYLLVHKDELIGVREEFLTNLKQEDDLIKLHCSMPLYATIMKTCESEDLRKKYAELNDNRAFPLNEPILKDLIYKRDELASLLGYTSFAHLRLKNEMSKTPETVAAFLNNLWLQCSKKEILEFESICSYLPDYIHLNKIGQLNSWDSLCASNFYHNVNLSISEDEIRAYFPLDSTLKGLINIYEQFFNINITEEPSPNLWHDDLKLLKISEKDNQTIGYIILDLFPRRNKFDHACNIPIIPGPIVNGEKLPGLELVVVNFPQPTHEKPSLLNHGNAQTFFHEFGHAIHSIFIKNETLYYSNLENIKYDYVELPSQLLEAWLWDANILAMISSHYQTGEPLPKDIIQKLINSKNTFSGTSTQMQCYFSFLALKFFSSGKIKEPTHIMRELESYFLPHYAPLNNGHFHLTFGHLTDYGPTYYGYLWSEVYAQDVFQEIKKEGLLNPRIGTRYRQEILEKGGAIDPSILLKNFLKREPNQQAFIKSLDIR